MKLAGKIKTFQLNSLFRPSLKLNYDVLIGQKQFKRLLKKKWG
jgi:hypothetical protein